MTSYVQYQYPDEEIQQVEGDDYTFDVEYINTTEWQATGEAEILLEDHPNEKTGWFTPSTFSEKQGEIGKGDITLFGGAKLGEAWIFGSHAIHVSSGLIGEWWKTPYGEVAPSRLYDTGRTSLYHFYKRKLSIPEFTYYYDNPVLKHWHPVNGDKKVTFEITLEEATKFSRTEINKDLIFVRIIQGQECPQETCPVLCEETICCYGADGMSVTSFLKAESIY